MKLRGYQEESASAVRRARKAGARRILLQMPTGGGKTVTAISFIARQYADSNPVLVLAHRKELLDQFFGALYKESIPAGIIRADDERADLSKLVQLASVDSLVRREKPPAKLIVVDEAHRTCAGRYQEILGHYPDAVVLGLTATPCRLDGRPLKEHYDVLVKGASYARLIAEGAIVAPRMYARYDPDLSGVRVQAGEFHQGETQEAMIHVVGNVVEEWRRHASDRATVVFAVGVDHAHQLAECFRQAGVRAAVLVGDTPEDERLKLLVDLELGRLQVVVNVNVLTEGWDQPRVKCCIDAAPTMSLTRHMQRVGRILRPWNGVEPVLLDHAGNIDRHGPPHMDRAWSLDGSVRRKSDVTFRTCGKCFAVVERMPCPLCGFHGEKKRRQVRSRSGELRELENVDPRRALYDSLVTRARKQGMKPGWAAVKYKERFGEWPPWSWKIETDKLVDDAWRTAIARRQMEREFFAPKKPGVDPGFTEEPE